MNWHTLPEWAKVRRVLGLGQNYVLWLTQDALASLVSDIGANGNICD